MEPIAKYISDLQESWNKTRERQGWKRLEVKEFDCEIHGKSKMLEWLSPEGELHPANCPQCRQIKHDLKARDELKAEAERVKALRLEKRLANAMIPMRFKYKRLDGFMADTEDKKRVFEFMKRYAENFDVEALQTGRSVILSGGPGTGKTHLSVGVANHVIEMGGTAMFSTVAGLVRRVRESWTNKTETEQEVIDLYSQPDLLIIDEIGVQSGSENEHQILFDIMNSRYENMRPTILLTNLPILDIRKPNGEVEKKGLQGFVGDRVLDRMREGGGKAFTLNWTSYRANKSNEYPVTESTAPTYKRGSLK